MQHLEGDQGWGVKWRLAGLTMTNKCDTFVFGNERHFQGCSRPREESQCRLPLVGWVEGFKKKLLSTIFLDVVVMLGAFYKEVRLYFYHF